MPSANPKQATEAEDPIRQAIKVIEHKIRNLEKRKTKLETYKGIQDSGKELNQDQKTAVAKYDEVLQTLDITRELFKGVVSIANDFAKQQKKLARKEALERTQQDIAKVREVLLVQDILINMGADTARDDFLNGTNGAPKLTDDDLKTLDDLYNELTAKRQTEAGEPPFAQSLQKSAEHFVAIIDGKQKEFVGTTYLKIKELFTTINSSGYFDQTHESEAPVQQTEDVSTEARISNVQAPEQPTEDYNAGEVHIPPSESNLQAPNFPVQVSQVTVVTGPAPVSGPLPVVAQPIPPHQASNLENAYYVNAPSYVPASQQTQPTQQGPPPPQQQLQQQASQQQQQAQQQTQQQPQPPRINDVIGNPDFFFLQESELDSPDVTGQNAPIVSHIPPAVNAPIPSQTFTNQSFAAAPVQVIYPHPPPPQDMPHIPGFANPNPPPPIPMPPSHQQPNLPYSPQHPAGFQQPPNSQQLQQTYDPTAHQQDPQHSMEDKIEQGPETTGNGEQESNTNVEWAQMNEQPLDEWGKTDIQESGQMSQQPSQQSQQAWGEQRGGYRGRGSRRGNSNGYNGRGRGGYQQNGRGGGGGVQGYYRNETNNYQNGYQQQRNYNNDGNSGYNGGFTKQGRGGGGSGSRGGSRGERTGMERGGRGGGPSMRGGQSRKTQQMRDSRIH
ncbi:caprin homolog [Venturia canescens]|uniref:caprin homolog n=1 Tax=Venturia canescens TaxID=32260 RepID=UPI001C9C68E0|nr:caprin homolog [Venturia canescens]